ncbi:hypothetical protein KAR91_63220 [Candidatus Pacearchaeota archaeon]|nr:hypothetical protein [Candidatus Pacearchaeota archaeon]
MQINKKTLIIGLVVISATILLAMFSNPLRRSESWIQTYVLNITPLGSSFDDVAQIIEKQGWEVAYKSKEHGFRDQGSCPEKIVGSMSIRASLGDYRGIPFKANVTVFWGFDEEGKLIDIWVWKTWDGI